MSPEEGQLVDGVTTRGAPTSCTLLPTVIALHGTAGPLAAPAYLLTGDAISSRSSLRLDKNKTEMELFEPNPDLHALFLQFNDMYFDGMLASVEVKWSSRMTLCAGVCSYEGRGGLCSIRLSEKLLAYRPRSDMIDTLLHEMIHAYLFLTEGITDRDGHGPQFQRIMRAINVAAGTSITIYHSFVDEVEHYRKHWWQCSGPCRTKPPYFGLAKRAMNRAPSKNDTWWAAHQQQCGGTYVKVKEPPKPEKKKRKQKVVSRNGSKRQATLEEVATSTVSNKEKGDPVRNKLRQVWSAKSL